MSKPLLTVLMSVKNGEPYLRETVESILNQTFRDFEFLILDNASTDNSREIVRSFNDPRIRLIELPGDIGQVAALNKGLDMIDTPLIARMDADDICLPRRFEMQVAFMEANPGVGISSAYVIAFDGKKELRWSWPCAPADIKVKLLFECSLAHPLAMMRKSLMDRYNLRYDAEIGHSFDWELWQRAAEHFDLANIPFYLLRYRLHAANESKKTLHMQRKAAEAIDTQTLGRLGLAHHPLRGVHRDTAFETLNVKERGPAFLNEAIRWFEELESANRRNTVYSAEALRKFLNERLFFILKLNTAHRRLILKIYFKKRLYRTVGFYRSFKFVANVFLSVFRLPGVK